MRSVCVQRYDLRIMRVDDDPDEPWVVSNDVYTRIVLAATRGAVDIVIEGTVHSFRTELSNMEGEERG